MKTNYKHLAETRGKMVEKYQDVMIPRYRALVEELQEENKRLKAELAAAQAERDAVTRRMIELEAMNGNK